MADFADAPYRITNKWMLQPLTDAYPLLPCPNDFRKGLKPGWRVLVTSSGGKVTSVTKAPPEERPAPAEAAAPPVAPATRPAGRPAAAPAAANRRPPGPRQGNNRPNNAPPQGNVPTGYFQNPYNFVPFSTAMRTGELAEAGTPGPLPCDRAHADRYSAKLAICFTTVTPLLTMEVSEKKKGESAVYTVRRDDVGKPIINGASVKGMLRSLYEQVTGSRLGIFNHPDPLSFRARTMRKSFPTSPASLLGTDFAPTPRETELTGAERVFGWVADKEGDAGQAVRGRLRVGGVRCLEEPGRMTPTATTWRLVPLNSPKPSHARFYTRGNQGDPLNGMAKGDGYRSGQHILAGHKVYPHQQRPATYWKLPPGGWPQPQPQPEHPQDGAHFLNFLAAQGTPPEVAMAIRDWVAPGASFATTLYVQDVTLQELLALLWVLDLSAPHEGGTLWHLKLGQGKPLGFGSIQLRVDWSESSILSTAQTKARNGAAPAGESPAAEGAANPTWADQIAQFGERFRRLAPATYLSIKAAAEGSDLPTHYPRVGTDQGEVAPQVETYQWFVDNEGQRRHALPLLTPTRTTPVETLPTTPRAPRGRPAARAVR